MQSRKINIAIQLAHCGKVSVGVMHGLGYLDSGFLAGRFDAIDGPWSEAEKLALCAFTFTGCPIAARTAAPAMNPWRWTNGSYESNRIGTLAGAKINSTLISKGGSELIDMELSISVAGHLPEIRRVTRPFQEAITEKSLGNLQGKFSIEFEGELDEKFTLNATTAYRLAINKHVPDSWRNITISANDIDATSLTLFEQIDLFHDERSASLDLAEKCAVWKR